MYELYFGCTPFYSDSHRQIFQNILKHDTITFPKEFVLENPNGVELISNLLENNSTTRLGCLLNGVDDIISHSFFHNFSWNELSSRTMTPPFVPILKEFGVAALVVESDDDEEDTDKKAAWMDTWGQNESKEDEWEGF